MNAFILLKGVLLGGTGLWLALIAFNNIADPRTNCGLIHRMFSMDGITPESAMGGGLARRAIKSERLPRVVLTFVVALQIPTAVLLMRAGLELVDAGIGWSPASVVERESANLALLPFASMWVLFLCGGLWFGYWITLPSVQTVHLLMLIVTIGMVLLVNT